MTPPTLYNLSLKELLEKIKNIVKRLHDFASFYIISVCNKSRKEAKKKRGLFILLFLILQIQRRSFQLKQHDHVLDKVYL